MGPFYIRRLKRRPWRALCAVLLCAAFAALLCRLASQASAQRDALANVHEHMDVRCTISNVQGTSTSHLRMSNGYLWRVQDPEGMLTPYIRDLQLTKEFTISPRRCKSRTAFSPASRIHAAPTSLTRTWGRRSRTSSRTFLIATRRSAWCRRHFISSLGRADASPSR